jgi:hypothetical protein
VRPRTGDDHDQKECLVVSIGTGCVAAIGVQQGDICRRLFADIGSAVAAGNFRAKNALFAVRSKGCAQPGKTELRGTAEGLVDGERRTVQLKHVTAMPTPGVFTVVQEWPPMGVWVVNLIAQCGESTASALVPIGPKGFVRESSKFFARPAAHEEITESLQGLAASPAQEQRAGSR